MKKYDAIVIGGGPAGLFAAINLSGGSRSVLILEKNQKPGKKLLLTGGGQCNLTHTGDVSELLKHYGDGAKFLRTALFSFSNTDLMHFFNKRSLKLITVEDGKVFPASKKAEDVLNVLLRECDKNGVEIECGAPVKHVEKSDDGFYVFTDTKKYLSKNLIIATGGMSYPRTGSTGDGYAFAKHFGHTINQVRPALTPLYVKDFVLKDLAGISFENLCFSLWRDGKKVREFSGDVLITHRGISGPGVLNNSKYVYAGDVIKINFINTNPERFRADFAETVAKNGGLTVKSILRKYPIPRRLADKILQLAGIPDEMTCANLKKEYRKRLVEMLTEFPIEVEKPGDFNVAMITKGGISLREVKPNSMESRLVKGLYFAGEILDIDGDTGGYNLQAAFSTGYLAARSILQNTHEIML